MHESNNAKCLRVCFTFSNFWHTWQLWVFPATQVCRQVKLYIRILQNETKLNLNHSGVFLSDSREAWKNSLYIKKSVGGVSCPEAEYEWSWSKGETQKSDRGSWSTIDLNWHFKLYLKLQWLSKAFHITRITSFALVGQSTRGTGILAVIKRGIVW